MRSAFIAILGLTLVGCSSLEPVKIQSGDVCFRCARTITDTKLAAEIVTADGNAFKFRTAGCLAKYLHGRTGDVGTVFVTDAQSGEMFQVSNAMFVRVTIDPATRERDYLAFKSATEAAKRASEESSSVVDWSAVRSMAASTEQRGN